MSIGWISLGIVLAIVLMWATAAVTEFVPLAN
jgi:hypothetical protein